MFCCFGSAAGAHDHDTGRSRPGTAAAAAAAAAARAAGDVLPSLPGCDLLSLLGRGSFGVVLLVRERATAELFAVKIMSKKQLVDEKQQTNATLERQVLRDAGPHPFVVECQSGFQTDDAVVLVLEYLPGGDFYDLLKKYGALAEDHARFYLAEVVVAVAELHRYNFVLRDLKLENILLDDNGHIRLTDFGLAARVNGIGDTSVTDLSGTAIYQAPEILDKLGHGVAVDWWALGVLAHVMMRGKPPFSSDDRTELYHAIRNEQPDLQALPWHQSTRDFVGRLLEKDPVKRLGSTGVQEIKQHPFFESINWEKLLTRGLPAPLAPPKSRPHISSDGDSDAHSAAEARKHFLGHIAQKSKAKPTRIPDFIDIHTRDPRTSIGLDFEHRHKKREPKTWTGTSNDVGRPITSLAQ